MSLISLQDEERISNYLNWVKRHKSENSFRTAKVAMACLRKIVTKTDREILELSSQEIEDHLFTKYDKPNTINAYRTGLSNFYNYYIKKGILAQSPILFPYAKKPKALPKPLTPTQQNILLKKIRNIKWKFAVELILNTGIRADEMAKLQFLDIDESEMVLRVRTRSEGGGGKGNKERLIPIPLSLVDSYQYYMKEYRAEKGDSPYVFLGKYGRPTDSQSLTYFLNRHREKFGFKVVTHMLRDTFASNHINRGTDIRVLQELMGHEDIKQTEKYTKVNLTRMRKAQEQGTILGEKDRLIAELTKKNREIENLRYTVKEMKEKLGNFLQIIDRMDDQEN